MPYIPDTPLEAAFRSLGDLCDDFQQSNYGNGHNFLQRIVAELDSEPLAGFIRERLPQIDYGQWLEQIQSGASGKAILVWPLRRSEKVAMQVALVRDLSQSEKSILGFCHQYTNAGYNSLSAHYQAFGDKVLRTLHRDLERISEDRDVPPLLAPALASLASSGDAKLDSLLAEAIEKFQNRDPQSQANGIERLWDAFERLKTLSAGDKRASAEATLATVAPAEEFREVLRTEMQLLTKIGNDFHIRHHEKNRSEIPGAEERDYLFYRLFALVHLMLVRLSATAPNRGT